MAVEHMVWIRFKPETSEAVIDSLMGEFEGLATSMDMILQIRAGENFTDRAAGCTHGVIVTLPDRAALPEYANHPAHLAFAQKLTAVAELSVMDIEV